MDYILDTHTLIWFLNGDDKLSKKAKETVEDQNNAMRTTLRKCASQPFKRLLK